MAASVAGHAAGPTGDARGPEFTLLLEGRTAFVLGLAWCVRHILMRRNEDGTLFVCRGQEHGFDPYPPLIAAA